MTPTKITDGYGSQEESTLLVNADNIDGDNDGQGDRLVHPVAMYFDFNNV